MSLKTEFEQAMIKCEFDLDDYAIMWPLIDRVLVQITELEAEIRDLQYKLAAAREKK